MHEVTVGKQNDKPILTDRKLWLICSFALLAIVVRLSLLSVPGRLTGLTEYDDGVYLGAALRLVQGIFPYKDYVLVQPPGITILLLPIAFIAKVVGTLKAMVIARFLTIVVSAINVVLMGQLVKSKGKVAIIAACGVMALYSQAVASSVTVLLEPYMNLFCLLGLIAIFKDLEFRSTHRSYLVGGILIGIAGSIKSWAIVPALTMLIVVLIFEKQSRVGKALRFAVGVVVGFLLFVFPFYVVDPGGLIHDVITVQLNRVPGGRVSLMTRLYYITGSGVLTHFFGHQSLVTILGLVLGIVMVVVLLRSKAKKSQPLWYFGAVTAVAVFAVLLYPSDFYYHYPDFLTPYIAIVFSFSAWLFADMISNRSTLARVLTIALAFYLIPITFIAAEIVYEHQQMTVAVPKDFASTIIPPGACVVSDVEAMLIESNRFYSNKKDCPTMLDSYGTALALSGGKTINGGAASSSKLDKYWLSVMKNASYIWLSPREKARLPWTSGNLDYFKAHYKRVSPKSPRLGTIFKKI